MPLAYIRRASINPWLVKCVFTPRRATKCCSGNIVGVEEILASFTLAFGFGSIRDPFRLTVPFGMIGKW